MVSVLHGVLYMPILAILEAIGSLKHLWSDEFSTHYDRIG